MISSSEIMSVHKNKIPIILSISDKSSIKLTKNKFIVPRDITIQQFHCILKKYMKITSKQSILFFINNSLPISSDTLGNIYNTDKSDDGFLYITVQTENTFG